MDRIEQLNDILKMVLGRKLGLSIGALENYLLANPNQHEQEQLRGIREDYQLMAGYWQRGFDDPQREQVCMQLLRRMYMLLMNIMTHREIADRPFLKALYQRPRKIRNDWSMSAVRASMEAFVSDLALLDLEPEQVRQQKSDELYAQHWELMRDLFDYIITSRQWRESLGDAFLELLLSPTLASIDQQLIVSAVTLSTMQHFCFQKWRVLCEVWLQATDEPLRQRALVGWALTADASAASLFTEMGDMMAKLCSNEATREQLAELQMQLVYCMQTEEDQNTIQKEIMPDLMNGSRMRMTREGLVEMDEDTLDDILHPEASELAMEQMEQSLHRMVDMQKQGADIYFGGFSQMKRFPFFNDISNWFVPFYPQHPGISKMWNSARCGKLLKTLTRVSAFCDSDKYSFVLAFDQVLDRLPQSMMKVMEQGEAQATILGGEVTAEEQKSPAFMRRLYLQNLYRFYRIYAARNEFWNPFDSNRQYLFFANRLFADGQLAQQSFAVARFLLKRRHYDASLQVLDNVPMEQYGYQEFILLGSVLQHMPEQHNITAGKCFRQALELQSDSERAMAGLARSLFWNHDYEEALELYSRLMTMKPEHRTYQLNAAVCLLNLGHGDEALKLLFKLNYMFPDDLSVTRVMAWAQTVSGHYEQAEKFYCQLLALENPEPTDMLNYGYCLWFSKNISTAIGMFHQFLSSQQDEAYSIADEFMKTEHQLIASHGISDAEILLMIDAVMS